MTRTEVDALLKAAPRGPGDQRSADLEGKRLSHLDLSGLDFSGSNLRLARLNRTDLKGARFDRAILNQAWLIDADLTMFCTEVARHGRRRGAILLRRGAMMRQPTTRQLPRTRGRLRFSAAPTAGSFLMPRLPR
jgi:hypothetical protein